MEHQALGKRIREERLKLNLTQEKLAEDVNLSTAYIGQIERGERSLTLDNLIAVVNRLRWWVRGTMDSTAYGANS